MSTRSLPTATTEKPNLSPASGVGLVKVVNNVPLVLNRYTAPAFAAPVSSNCAPTSTRSLPIAATGVPKLPLPPATGLVKVVSNPPLMLNRYASLVLSPPITKRSLPTAATERPNKSPLIGLGLVIVSANQLVTVASFSAVTPPAANASVVTDPKARLLEWIAPAASASVVTDPKARLLEWIAPAASASVVTDPKAR